MYDYFKSRKFVNGMTSKLSNVSCRKTELAFLYIPNKFVNSLDS